MSTTSTLIMLTPEEAAADTDREARLADLAEAIQKVKDLVGDGVKITLADKFGAFAEY